MVPTLETRIGT